MKTLWNCLFFLHLRPMLHLTALTYGPKSPKMLKSALKTVRGGSDGSCHHLFVLLLLLLFAFLYFVFFWRFPLCYHIDSLLLNMNLPRFPYCISFTSFIYNWCAGLCEDFLQFLTDLILGVFFIYSLPQNSEQLECGYVKAGPLGITPHSHSLAMTLLPPLECLLCRLWKAELSLFHPKSRRSEPWTICEIELRLTFRVNFW